MTILRHPVAVATSALVLAVGALLAPVAAHAQKSVKLIERSKAWGSATADYNRDGHDDLFITGHDFYDDRIWYWTGSPSGSGYEKAPWVFTIEVDRHDCDPADVDGDGLIDLYCAVGGEQGQSTDKSNELYLQQPDGTFVLTPGHGAEDSYGRSRIPRFFDLNHDGRPDLYDSNLATPRPDGQPNINHVYLNIGGGKFTEVITNATGNIGQQCVVKGDINRDGWDDLVVCHEKLAPSVFVNTHDNNLAKLPLPQFNAEWSDAKLVDLDHDGYDDLVVLTAANHLQVWRNTRKSPFFAAKPTYDNALPANTHGLSVSVADLNQDGFLDFYVVLEDPDCRTTLVDKAPDVVYWGSASGFRRQTLSQAFDGCGHLSDVVDGHKILLMNGGVDQFGPNYILDWME